MDQITERLQEALAKYDECGDRVLVENMKGETVEAKFWRRRLDDWGENIAYWIRMLLQEQGG